MGLSGVVWLAVGVCGVLLVFVLVWPSVWMRALDGVLYFVTQRRPRPYELKCRCGYDLRGSPERCPECGAEVPRMMATLVRYRMRVEKLDELEARRKRRGE